MQLYNRSKLHTLFWEIKNRCFYIFLSFVFCFVVAYQNCKFLLYLFVLSYTNLYKIPEYVPSFEGLNFIINLVESDVSMDLAKQKETYLQYDNENTTVIEKNCAFFTQYDIPDLLNFSKFLKSIDICSVHFIFTDIEEAFSTHLLVCFIFSLICILPLFIYESFSFFSPSLYFHENKKWSFRLFAIIFGWYWFVYNIQAFFIPKLAKFLLEFQISNSGFNLLAETKINSYCSWASTIFLATNFGFFFVVWIFFLIINKQLKIQYFTIRRKLSAMVMLLVSALITPPEFIQIFLALFFFFCFEIFIYFFFVYKYFCVKKNI